MLEEHTNRDANGSTPEEIRGKGTQEDRSVNVLYVEPATLSKLALDIH